MAATPRSSANVVSNNVSTGQQGAEMVYAKHCWLFRLEHSSNTLGESHQISRLTAPIPDSMTLVYKKCIIKITGEHDDMTRSQVISLHARNRSLPDGFSATSELPDSCQGPGSAHKVCCSQSLLLTHISDAILQKGSTWGFIPIPMTCDDACSRWLLHRYVRTSRTFTTQLNKLHNNYNTTHDQGAGGVNRNHGDLEQIHDN